jgi:hypothetical protein
MLEEAKKAAEAAREKILGVAAEERQKYVEDVQTLLKKGSAGGAGGGGAPALDPAAGDVGTPGTVGAFQFQEHLAEQAKLEANARIHSEWLSRQLVAAASSQAGRLTLPLPAGADSADLYQQQVTGIAARQHILGGQGGGGRGPGGGLGRQGRRSTRGAAAAAAAAVSSSARRWRSPRRPTPTPRRPNPLAPSCTARRRPGARSRRTASWTPAT